MSLELPREPGEDESAELLQRAHRVADDCLVASCEMGWEDAAREYSKRAGGQWHFNAVGLTWKMGTRTLWVRDHSSMADILASRLVCDDLGVEAGWSVGRCARSLLSWIGEPQPTWGSYDHIHDQAGTGFRCIRPGRYEDVTVWDARQYYYRLFTRLPSLRCSPGTDGSVTWFRMLRDELARRRDLESRIADVKPLRNALWGAALGSSQWRYFYHRGQRKPFGPRRGPFHLAALCLARGAWELTRDAAEEVESIYSHTDCVTSLGGLYPSVWDRAGIEVAVKLAGPADLRHLQSWRIGPQPSKLYDPCGLWEEPIAIAPAPPVRYGLGWAYEAA
jgi:hypothetical protein